MSKGSKSVPAMVVTFDLQELTAPISCGAQASESERLTTLHEACRVVACKVLAPWILGNGAMTAYSAFELGAACAAALEPVRSLVANDTGRSRRTIDIIVYDSLLGHLLRLSRQTTHEPPLKRIDEFRRGAGDRRSRPPVLSVHADDGPPILLVLPAVCCVLQRSLDPDACPTCPRHPDDEARRIATIDWLESLDHDQFENATGRPRCLTRASDSVSSRE